MQKQNAKTATTLTTKTQGQKRENGESVKFAIDLEEENPQFRGFFCVKGRTILL